MLLFRVTLTHPQAQPIVGVRQGRSQTQVCQQVRTDLDSLDSQYTLESVQLIGTTPDTQPLTLGELN